MSNREFKTISTEIENFLCYFCKNILDNPKFCRNCNSYFCLNCILEKNCCKNKHLQNPHPLFWQYISKIEFYCIFKKYGCKKILNFKELKDHENKCIFNIDIELSKLSKYEYSLVFCKFCEKNINSILVIKHLKHCNI